MSWGQSRNRGAGCEADLFMDCTGGSVKLYEVEGSDWCHRKSQGMVRWSEEVWNEDWEEEE